MLNPKEYRFIGTKILSYKELVKWENSKCPNSVVQNEAYSCKSSDYFNEQIKKYQEDGFIVEIINMSTNIKEGSTDFGIKLLHTIHLALYMPI